MISWVRFGGRREAALDEVRLRGIPDPTCERLFRKLFREALGRGIAPGRRDSALQRFLADCLEVHTGGAAASPCTLGWHENPGIIFREIVLLLRSELDHPPAFGGIPEGGKNLSLDAKIGMVHMSMFRGLRKSQCQAAKIVGGHERVSPNGTCVR